MEIGSALALALADKVGHDRYQLWFGAHTRLELEDETVTVNVANSFFQDWLRSNFRRQIEDSCLETLGKSICVRFHVDSSLECQAGATAAGGPPRCSGLGGSPGSPAGAAAATAAAAPGTAASGDAPPTAERTGVQGGTAGIRPEPPPGSALPAGMAQPGSSGAGRPSVSGHRPDLKSFASGNSSRLAYAAALNLAARQGSPSPVLMHGPTGVGKTHLVRAVVEAVRRQDPRVQAVYLSAEQFTTLFLGALHGGGLPSFRRKYRGLDLLVIDDIQFFAGKRATLMELLNTVDSFSRDRRQLVFAADRPPGELGALGPELVTRLQGGLVCGIEPPEYETRLAIVAQMARESGLDVPREVQQFIAASLHAHARELSGALNRLAMVSRAMGRPISLSMATEGLADLLAHGSRGVRLEDVDRAVCEEFGIRAEHLRSRRKTRDIIHARSIAMYVARRHTGAALSEIGHHFGCRAHSTVISAQKKVHSLMSTSATLRLAVGQVEAEEAVRRVERRLMAS